MLSNESKQLLKQQFTQKAEEIYGQRERSIMGPNLNFVDFSKLSPADQATAKRFFPGKDLRKLTLEEKDAFLDFKNKNTPTVQEQLFRDARNEEQQTGAAYGQYTQDISDFRDSKSSSQLEPDRWNYERNFLIESINADPRLNPLQKRKLISFIPQSQPKQTQPTLPQQANAQPAQPATGATTA
jgi:hypothetical protein